MVVKRADLGDVADMLEILAARLRVMMHEGEGSSRDDVRRQSPDGVFTVGVRVRIVVRDFYGRTGVLTSRRGRLYWNIRLDPRDGEVSKLIYKKETSLRLVDE